jgi:hypothetical protein
MVGIGLISYSAYLWHQPMFAFYRLQFAPSASLPAMLLLSALSLAIGWLSWRFVENPFRSRVRVPWKQVALMMTAAAALVMLLPALALKGGAGMARFDPEDQVIMAQMMTKPATSYVAKRFNARKLKDFDPSKRLKLLIIGDSYAQDLVNALCECGIDKDISISTNYISARCGNLCVPYDLSSYWESGDRALCESTVGYQNQRLLELIRAANVVLLVSNWRTWQAPLVPESLRNIQALTEATVVVVGRKRFGRSGDVRFDPRTFLHRSDAEKAALRTYLNDEDLTVNRQMKQSLPPANYLDFQEAVSRDGTSSPLFDEELNLISFDGSHLTKTGALFVGKRLLENPLMRSLLKLDDRR